MARRMYFMLPNIKTARAMMDDLLLTGINSKHIHFFARPGTPMGDLPEATISQRADLTDGWEIGMGLGAALGFGSGMFAVWVPPWPFNQQISVIAVLICTIAGFLVGSLWTTLMASSLPSTRLKQFEQDIASGKVLMMVVAPFHRILEVRDLVQRKHPEAIYSGTWSNGHALFP